MLFHISVQGRENIPVSNGFILASNHTSYLDPIILGVVCHKELYFVVKRELFRLGAFSWLIKNLNTFPITRGQPELSALKKILKKLRQGGIVVIFPEGTRSKDGRLGKPEKGAGLIAIKSNLPVVPVYIQGTYEALPVGSRCIRLNPIKVWFGKPISSDVLKNAKDLEHASNIIMEEIKNAKGV
jgi:1-acyl-sn-glycerol-3-phosphate acyltransferase